MKALVRKVASLMRPCVQHWSRAVAPKTRVVVVRGDTWKGELMNIQKFLRSFDFDTVDQITDQQYEFFASCRDLYSIPFDGRQSMPTPLCELSGIQIQYCSSFFALIGCERFIPVTRAFCHRYVLQHCAALQPWVMSEQSTQAQLCFQNAQGQQLFSAPNAPVVATVADKDPAASGS